MKQATLPCTKLPVEYLPPNANILEEYSRTVCQELAKTIDDRFAATDFQRELTNFLKIIGKMYAKHLNKNGGQPLDKDHAKR